MVVVGICCFHVLELNTDEALTVNHVDKAKRNCYRTFLTIEFDSIHENMEQYLFEYLPVGGGPLGYFVDFDYLNFQISRLTAFSYTIYEFVQSSC